ncbi:META domain-containing protein [Celerinatantimonas yamalensis]|uniref:META domain-containing protein n=1 Tax=Celerinatantimonas yamalensis TaxID=559956 RepID=A0ABW9G5F5_9GAMM
MRIINSLINLSLAAMLAGCNGYPPPLNRAALNQTQWRATSPYDAHQYVQFNLRQVNQNLALYGQGGCHRFAGMMRVEGNRISLDTPLMKRNIQGCQVGREMMINHYIDVIQQGLIFDAGAFYSSDGSVVFHQQMPTAKNN